MSRTNGPSKSYMAQPNNAAKRTSQPNIRKSTAILERAPRECGDRIQAWCSWSPYVNDDEEMTKSIQALHPAKETRAAPNCHELGDKREDICLKDLRTRVILSSIFQDSIGAKHTNNQTGVQMCLYHGDPTSLPRRLATNDSSTSNNQVRVSNSLYPYRRRGEPSDESNIPCKNYNHFHKHRMFADKLACDEQAAFDDSTSAKYLKPVTPIRFPKRHKDIELPAIDATPEPEPHPVSSPTNHNTDCEEPNRASLEEANEYTTNSPSAPTSPTCSLNNADNNRLCWTITNQSASIHPRSMNSLPSGSMLPVSAPTTRQSSAGSAKGERLTPSLTTMQQYVADKFGAPLTQSGLKVVKQAQLIESLLLYQHRRVPPEKSATKQPNSITRTQSLLTAPDIRRTTAQMLKHQSPITTAVQATNSRQYYGRGKTQTSILPRVPQSGNVTAYRGRCSKTIGATVKLDKGTTAGMIAVPHIGLQWKFSKNE